MNAMAAPARPLARASGGKQGDRRARAGQSFQGLVTIAAGKCWFQSGAEQGGESGVS